LQANANYQAFATLAASLGLLGETAQAKEVAARLLQSKPRYSAETARQGFFFCNDSDFVNRYLEGLRVVDIFEM
jgi:hypothetical protein